MTTKAVKDQWGYPFGVDGVVSLAKVCEKLDLSHDTVERLIDQGKLRPGRHPGNKRRGKVTICKRSIDLYLKSIELQIV